MKLNTPRLFLIGLFITFLVGCNTTTVPLSERENSTGAFLYQKGLSYYYGEGVIQDYSKAFQYFQYAAQKKDIKAINSLGTMYDEGKGTQKNRMLAKQYYEEAVKANLPAAQYNLATWYYEANPKDPKVKEYLELAVANKYPDAYFLLGKIQYDDKNYAKAYQNLLKASEFNHPEALYLLGVMSARGEGTSKSDRKAIQYYTEAAKAGNKNAQFNLGAIYFAGDGVRQDKKKAAEYFKKASLSGHTQAMVNLAIMNAKGDGVPVDIKQATVLFELAASKGDPKAKEVVKQFKSQ